MMGKTHFTIGLATSLLVMRPDSLGECAAALIAGSFGGITPDVDTMNQSNSSRVFLHALVTTLGALVVDFFMDLGICEAILANQTRALIGLIGFVTLWIFGYFSDHRTFTHSLTAMFLFSLCVGCIYEPLALCYMAAYLSHLLLDMLNKKKIPLLYPLDFGVAFKFCYASSKVDTVFWYIGGIVSAVMLVLGFIFSITA